ncbi:MAG: HD domain-containing protein [Prevotella sp.]|nr:HD domain-containing protein [Prevotella sp.]
MTDGKMINDPVHGFIKVPPGLLLDIVNHPLMQRLTRIKQLGLASVVYPSAQHTRFQHSIGAFHLMSEAIRSLQQKGIFIFDSEAEAVCAAILMHDIGHGPFSHVLENTLIHGITHEEISLMMMEQINHEMNGALNLAMIIYKDEYNKKFLHQLISSQLDMDRLDYLRRDSFFTGVQEASIGSDRIIKMLDVVDDRLVVNAKGIYSIENYLTSRRLMYWQVYLHKTTVAYEKLLVNCLTRARDLALQGKELFCTPALRYFLYQHIDAVHFAQHPEALQYYELLDDSDIWSAIKVWMHDDDKILATLASNLVKRILFRVEIYDEQVPEERIQDIRQLLMDKLSISQEETRYFVSVNEIHKDMYDIHDDHIDILLPDGTIKDISEASDLLYNAIHYYKNSKNYLCYHRI